MWIQITAGRGPVECQWVVGQVLAALSAEAQQAGLAVELLEAVQGDGPGLLRSVLLSAEGAGLVPFVRGWQGSIQWVGKSAQRPNHKRRNYFVGVEALEPPQAQAFSDKDLVFETMRGAGPGGQHVNKTESCVRVTHLPSGRRAVGREERSQQQNRRLAVARLAALLKEDGEEARARAEQTRWDQHNSLERGNPTRTYEGPGFTRRLA